VDPLIADVSESSIFYGRIGGPLTKSALTAGEFVQASGARIDICPAGANGRGGDYNPTKASCDLGAIVLNGDTFCPAGANGPFSIYNPTKAYCDLGLIVPIGYQVCSPQPGGFQHEIYDPFIASCEDGVIVPLFPPLGDVECSPGLLGLGGFYSTEHSYCDFGIIVPLGFSYCIPGAYGPGGFYQTSAGGSCDRGVVVPKGDSYCAPGPNGLGGIYQPSAGQSCDKGKIQSSP